MKNNKIIFMTNPDISSPVESNNTPIVIKEKPLKEERFYVVQQTKLIF